MKYNQPYGISDPNAPYINGDPSIGRQGSIPPAESIEFPQRELVNFFNISNLIPSNDDLNQLARSVQIGLVNFATDTGTQNAMQCELNPQIISAEYPLGLMIRLKVLHTNLNDATHTTFTLDAGIGPRNVIMPDGSLPPDQVLKSGGVYLFIFDGTRWQVAGAPAGGGGGGGTTYAVQIPYVQDTGPSSNNIIALYTPAVTAITEGLFIAVKLAHPLITAICNITVNSNPVKKIARADGSSPIAGDADTNQILLLCFDGVNFQIVGVLGIPVSRPTLRACVPAPYGQSVPGNVATQVTGLSVTLLNTLNTSTWNGTAFICGEGEQGLWHFRSIAAFGNMIQRSVYTWVQRLRPSDNSIRPGAQGYGPSPSFPCDCSALGATVMDLKVGDVVTVWTAQYVYPSPPAAQPYYQPGYVYGAAQPGANIEFTFINRP